MSRWAPPISAEAEIENLGTQKEQINSQGGSDVHTKLAALESQLHQKMMEWEKWSTELEALRTKYPDLK